MKYLCPGCNKSLPISLPINIVFNDVFHYYLSHGFMSTEHNPLCSTLSNSNWFSDGHEDWTNKANKTVKTSTLRRKMRSECVICGGGGELAYGDHIKYCLSDDTCLTEEQYNIRPSMPIPNHYEPFSEESIRRKDAVYETAVKLYMQQQEGAF